MRATNWTEEALFTDVYGVVCCSLKRHLLLEDNFVELCSSFELSRMRPCVGIRHGIPFMIG